MDIKELIRHLDAPACEICPNQADCDTLEVDCLHRQAAAALKAQQHRIDELESECVRYVKAAFRLGQVDMRDRAAATAHEAAAGTFGIANAAAHIVADVIKDLEVSADGKRQV